MAKTAVLTGVGRRRGIAEELIAAATGRMGPLHALVMAHCESVDSDLLTTSVESFDRHYAVNVRAS